MVEDGRLVSYPLNKLESGLNLSISASGVFVLPRHRGGGEVGEDAVQRFLRFGARSCWLSPSPSGGGRWLEYLSCSTPRWRVNSIVALMQLGFSIMQLG